MTDTPRDGAAHTPLVSCLMVTLAVPERFAAACASIDAYCRQTLQNKELILVVNGGLPSTRQALIDHANSLDRHDIRIVAPSGGQTLGALRNISIENAAGDIVCQWDDDDLHHPERLERQAAALLQSDRDAILLQDVMQYFPRARELFWTNWRATPLGGHPGTLMARARATIRYARTGPNANRGEDSDAVLALKARDAVGTLAAMPHLFVYVSHGANTWDDAHHRRLADSLAISSGLLYRREAPIRAGLLPFGLASNTVRMVGNAGPAFLI